MDDTFKRVHNSSIVSLILNLSMNLSWKISHPTVVFQQKTEPKRIFLFPWLFDAFLTDKIWAKEIVYPAKEKYNSLFFSNRELFWQTIKKDWYDLDFMYLKSNLTFEAFQIYREIKDIKNTYLDFFSKTAFEDRRRFILNFYAEGVANIVEHDTYLAKEKLDAFVIFAANKIVRQISELEQNNA